jgi:cytochrome P450
LQSCLKSEKKFVIHPNKVSKICNIAIPLADSIFLDKKYRMCAARVIFGPDFTKMPSFFHPLAMAFDTATKSTLQRLLYASFLWRLGKIFSIRVKRRLKESLQFVENYMNNAITVRKESLSDDLLSPFINKRDVDGKPFSMSVLQRIALNFVLVGRDTLSVALS